MKEVLCLFLVQFLQTFHLSGIVLGTKILKNPDKKLTILSTLIKFVIPVCLFVLKNSEGRDICNPGMQFGSPEKFKDDILHAAHTHSFWFV